MHARLKPVRILLAIGVVCCGMGMARAQSSDANSTASTMAPQVKPPSLPPNACASGKAKCITTDMRWQAAARNADRRADQIRKNNGKAKGKNK